MTESIEKIECFEDSNPVVIKEEIILPDDIILENHFEEIMIKPEVHESCVSAPFSNHFDKNEQPQKDPLNIETLLPPAMQNLQNNLDNKLQFSSVRLSHAEHQRNYRARKKYEKQLQEEEILSNNPDAILKSSHKRLTHAEHQRNYRARKKEEKRLQEEKMLRDNPDAILKSSQKRLTHAEHQRNYRARKKEKKRLQEEKMLKINPNAIIELSRPPLTTAERVRNHRARQKKKKLLNSQVGSEV